MITAVADVIGDQLASDGSWPRRQYFLDRIDKRVKARIAFVQKRGATEEKA